MKWSTPSFHRCLQYVEESDRLLHLCMQGLSHISSMPELAKALAELQKLDQPLTPEEERDLEETHARSKFAQEEIDKGFPTLHAHTTIALWAALEALVEDLAAVWLLNQPDVLGNECFSKIRIPLAEYERLDEHERMALLVKELTRSTNADLKLGVSRFEVMLDPLGLSGPVDDDIRRTLFELSQVRNVLVHRASLVDRRFKESCPWVDAQIGTKLQIDHKTYVGYNRAARDYVLCLINRVRVHFGIEPYGAVDESTEAAKGDGCGPSPNRRVQSDGKAAADGPRR